MELKFEEFALTISANEIEVPFGLMDETLFLTVKKDLIALLAKDETSIHYFGYAPDNTADEQDELLTEGVFFRIIGYEKNLGIDLESTEKEVVNAFKYLVENYRPRWTTIIVEEGKTVKEITIELLYQDVFL
jgi:hypothetical protein